MPKKEDKIPRPEYMDGSTMTAFFNFCEEQGVDGTEEEDWWAWWEFWYDGYNHAMTHVLGDVGGGGKE